MKKEEYAQRLLNHILEGKQNMTEEEPIKQYMNARNVNPYKSGQDIENYKKQVKELFMRKLIRTLNTVLNKDWIYISICVVIYAIDLSTRKNFTFPKAMIVFSIEVIGLISFLTVYTYYDEKQPKQ